jgi:hypothetical protein
MDEKLGVNKYIVFGLALIGAISFTIWVIIPTIDAQKREDDLIKREISGVLIKVKDLNRGSYSILIKENKTGTELEYDLHMSRFIKENNIQVNDSISKEGGSHTLNFFKKKNGIYEKCCDLYYY